MEPRPLRPTLRAWCVASGHHTVPGTDSHGPNLLAADLGRWATPLPAQARETKEATFSLILDVDQPPFLNTHGRYALPGEAGNSFGPSLVSAPDGLMYMFHNDESQHDGVHQWVLAGAEELVLSAPHKAMASVRATESN